MVLHTSASGNPAIAEAIRKLEHEFPAHQDYKAIDFQPVPITNAKGQALEDVHTRDAAESAFRTLYRELLSAKNNRECIHLSIAGGRKTLSAYGMVAAQLLFEDDDYLWHLYSGGEFLESKRLHPRQGDDVHLIEIPVVLWSCTAPAFLDLGKISDPFLALNRQKDLRLGEMAEKQRSFIQTRLSTAEENVVRYLVRHGAKDQEIAKALNISSRTVESHLQSAFHKAEFHWNLTAVNRTQLVSLLSIYYNAEIRNSTDDASE